MSETLEQFKARQADEYGQFVATQRITHDGALAYRAGHPVPASNVALYDYEKRGLVKRVDTSTKADPTPPSTPAAAAATTEKK